MTEDDLQQTVDHVAISRLQQAYADVVTRRDWPGLYDLFTRDATVDLDLVTRPALHMDGPGELGTFVGQAIERFEHFQFVILNSHIELWPDGDRNVATARVFMAELRQVNSVDGRDDAHGLYRDTYRRIDGRWWITARRYRSMARFPSGEVFPLPPDLT
ncbi:nuclear transport factor 2 family protein [Aquihabitans sp. G128]|uniref:nuclear transport factor 2 family protein n=1 Tax=Aquihabitans sp. G128 TaxID=2849779 RepID=UPI001C21A0E5|nr:nuclear transport factor 2 family protein [Aquihabitans sp. G128]QXC59600.1 nuclear transport factor 2 family protein [Aquihabitans sp. G128]